MRIFIGLTEIANVAHTYARGFRALGHSTYTLVERANTFYSQSDYDVVLRDLYTTRTGLYRHCGWRVWIRLARLHFLWQAIQKCDLFIFLFGSAFFPSYADYVILKGLNRQIVSVFLGNEARYSYAYEQEMRKNGYAPEIEPYLDYARCYPNDNYFRKLRTVRISERYSDLILNQPSSAQLQIRPYMRMSIPLELSKYRFYIPERAVPVVAHIPSDRGVKGTEFVIAAVEKLKQEGIHFEFRLIENMQNDDVREVLAEADIVIDQLFSETIATLALEGLATGNAVLARYLPERSLIPSDCPVVNVTINTLCDKLRGLILDREGRHEIALAGRSYVEKYHAHTHVTQQILDWLQPEAIKEYDFVPTFFQQEFEISPQQLEDERRKLMEEKAHRIRALFPPKHRML